MIFYLLSAIERSIERFASQSDFRCLALPDVAWRCLALPGAARFTGERRSL